MRTAYKYFREWCVSDVMIDDILTGTIIGSFILVLVYWRP